ncbi:MAG: aminoglycoside phosphotransferase family protein [Bacteroidales bacterium]
MQDKRIETLQALYAEQFGSAASEVVLLPPSGSSRSYFRMKSQKKCCIGAFHEEIRENRAFLSFSAYFRGEGLPVPEIYAISPDMRAYLQEDLGDTTLLHFLEREAHHISIGPAVKEAYQKSIAWLVRFQLSGTDKFDYSVCYPRAAFDEQSMAWDMNYFKYYFLRFSGIPFDEQLLEEDFQNFGRYLLETDTHYFLYRDFQSRNIMLRNGEPYFIDYQGGRKGALQYDIASLLFEAKTALTESFREEMLEYYLDSLQTHIPVKRESFKSYYYAYALIRTMQAMGAYGYRGIFEKKPLFLESIPPALAHLRWLLDKAPWPKGLHELRGACERLASSDRLLKMARERLSEGL